jgi:sigma-E factor negative regulatory protein RseA
MQTSELLSALADGQLAGDDFVAAVQACQQDASALARWDSYHLIGDVLRLPARGTLRLSKGADLAFVDRLNQRLAQETLAGALRPGLDSAPSTQGAGALAYHRGTAANEGNFRWKLVAGFTSLAAVSVIAWNASGLLALPSAAPQLAQAGGAPQVVVVSPQGLMVRDARLEELLAAHAQLSGSSALQLPSGFLRNATFELPQRAGR